MEEEYGVDKPLECADARSVPTRFPTTWWWSEGVGQDTLAPWKRSGFRQIHKEGTPVPTQWLKEDLWRSHVSWLTPTWVGKAQDGRTDFDAKQWLDRIESAHYKTIIFYIKHHDGFTTYPSRYLTVKPERDFFGECVGEARKRGMRIIAYYSAVLDEITGNERPDWRVMGRDGAPVKGWALWPNAYCCINNPGYRGLVLGQLAELQDTYGPDGFWLDIFWPVLGENCFCSFCRRKYEEETGGDLLATQGEGWYDSCFVELMREIRALVKGNNPDCLLGQNTGTRIRGSRRMWISLPTRLWRRRPYPCCADPRDHLANPLRSPTERIPPSSAGR